MGPIWNTRWTISRIAQRLAFSKEKQEIPVFIHATQRLDGAALDLQRALRRTVTFIHRMPITAYISGTNL
jgi:hypothetical protein